MLLAVMFVLLCAQERMTATGQSEQQEDEEKAALRQHIQQLEDAAARGEGIGEQAGDSQATDQERLEAALQQERLQARIYQLEVWSCLHTCIYTCKCLKWCANYVQSTKAALPLHLKGFMCAIVVIYPHGDPFFAHIL